MSTNPTTSNPQPAVILADETVAISPLKKPVTSVKFTQRDLIDQGIAALFDGAVVEMRIPDAGRFRVISGYFDDYKKLADEIEQWSGVDDIAGVYYCINPVDPALLARAANRARTYAKLTTKDEDIACRRWLLIDCDPNRPAGISSTDNEKQLAFEKGKVICAYLRESGWPEPLIADSANGFHLLYRVDLPNNKEASVLVQNCLNALSDRFSDKDNRNGVKVDTTVGNAARIVKAYGSLGAKGDSIIDRPHRFSRLLRAEIAGGKEVVSTEKLRELAAQSSTANPPTSTSKTDYSGPKITPDRVEEFLEFYGVEHREQVQGPAERSGR